MLPEPITTYLSEQGVQTDDMAQAEYYIVDVREEWRGKPYITVWRPNNKGYAYPLSWAGRYSREQIDSEPRYYHSHRYPSMRVLDRFPVPSAFVEAMVVDPYRGDIDGDAGPVVLNNKRNRAKLRRARYNPLADVAETATNTATLSPPSQP